MSTPAKNNGTGLEDVNIPGQAFLREALTSCTDPLKAIESFQLENGVLLPSLRPMLPLLDLHGVRRLDFHTSLMEELRDKLIAHINELGQKDPREREKKLKELLVKSFPVVRVKYLRPVVMAILRNTQHIDDKYLRILVRDRELYADTDTEVKRQIWRDNQSLFGDEVSPLLSQYIREKEHILFDHTNLNNLFFQPTPKVRRQGEVVQKLANMIGTSVKLYDMVLQFLRTLFLRTPGHRVHGHPLRRCWYRRRHKIRIQLMATKRCRKRCTKAAPAKLQQTKRSTRMCAQNKTGKSATVAALFSSLLSPSNCLLPANVIAPSCLYSSCTNLHQCVQKRAPLGVLRTHIENACEHTHTHAHAVKLELPQSYCNYGNSKAFLCS